MLTSLDDGDLRDVGVDATPRRRTCCGSRASRRRCGLDGVVCSAQEAPALRAACGAAFTLVTPGIRPAERPRTTRRASSRRKPRSRDGADYLVIGRPITQAADPLAALAAINASLGVAA